LRPAWPRSPKVSVSTITEKYLAAPPRGVAYWVKMSGEVVPLPTPGVQHRSLVVRVDDSGQVEIIKGRWGARLTREQARALLQLLEEVEGGRFAVEILGPDGSRRAAGLGEELEKGEVEVVASRRELLIRGRGSFVGLHGKHVVGLRKVLEQLV